MSCKTAPKWCSEDRLVCTDAPEVVRGATKVRFAALKVARDLPLPRKNDRKDDRAGQKLCRDAPLVGKDEQKSCTDEHLLCSDDPTPRTGVPLVCPAHCEA